MEPLQKDEGKGGRKGMTVTLNCTRKSQGDAKSGQEHFVFDIGSFNTFFPE